MRAIRFLFAACIVLAVAVGAFVFAAWRPAIVPVEPPAASSFDAAQVQRGAQLAAIGNCAVCHSAPGGQPFAGGRAIPTPFGTIFSTNITPDPETGIGRWSEAAFLRAMREGVRRDGRFLYPAFPYDHFTLVNDEDNRALYAFLMTRTPVRAEAPANELPFPLNVRLLMFAWNLLFLHQGPYRADGAQSAAFNRGAYLAKGLGHCGACHTPRNFLGAEKSDRQLAGGEAEGWTAYALNRSSPAPVPWTQGALERYLRDGFDPLHGVARGPMEEVRRDLRQARPSDLRSLAAYIAAQGKHRRALAPQAAAAVQLQQGRDRAGAANSADSQVDAIGASSPSRTSTDRTNDEGALIYTAACAACHDGPRAMPYGGIDLALSSGISGPTAQNLVNVILNGLPAAEAAHSSIMPGFAASLSDSQVAALARYLRTRFSDQPPWTDIEGSVRAARNAGQTVSPAPSSEGASPQMQQSSDNEAQH
jgi:mono/diheme cytochrome c family protein